MKGLKDPTLALLEESGAPVTRENYLNLAFLGEVPKTIDPEIESEFPQQFQTGFRKLNRRLRARARRAR